jgi:hypothetical protein
MNLNGFGFYEAETNWDGQLKKAASTGLAAFLIYARPQARMIQPNRML